MIGAAILVFQRYIIMEDINDDTDYNDVPEGADETTSMDAEGHTYYEDDDGNWSRLDEDGGQWYTNERYDEADETDSWTEGLNNEQIISGLHDRGLDYDYDTENATASIIDYKPEEQTGTTETEEERIEKLTNAYKKQEEENRAALLKNNDKLSNRILNDLNVAFGGYDKYTGLNKIGETREQATNNYQDRQGNYGELLDRARNIGYGIMTSNGKYLDDLNNDSHVDWYEAILGHGLNTSTQALNAISGSLGLGGQLGNDVYDIYNIGRGKTANETDLSKGQQIAATIGKSVGTAALSYIDPVSQILNQIESKTNKYTTDENGNKIATGGVVSQFAEKNPLLSSALGTALPYINQGVAGVGGDLIKRGIENILTAYNNRDSVNTNLANEVYESNNDYNDINKNTAAKTEHIENIDTDIQNSINNLYNNDAETRQMAKQLLRNFDDKKKQYIADKGLVRNNETIALSDERLKSFVIAQLYDNEAMKKMVGNQIIMEYWNGNRNNVPYANRTF